MGANRCGLLLRSRLAAPSVHYHMLRHSSRLAAGEERQERSEEEAGDDGFSLAGDQP